MRVRFPLLFVTCACLECIERYLRNYPSFVLLRFMISSKGNHHPWRSRGSLSGQDTEITGKMETNQSLQVTLGQLYKLSMVSILPDNFSPHPVKLLLGLRGWEITWGTVGHTFSQLAFQFSGQPMSCSFRFSRAQKGVFPLMRKNEPLLSLHFSHGRSVFQLTETLADYVGMLNKFECSVKFKIAAASLKRSK